jgi:hypothetical protein
MTVASDPGNLTLNESSASSSKESAVGCVTIFSLVADSTTDEAVVGCS